MSKYLGEAINNLEACEKMLPELNGLIDKLIAERRSVRKILDPENRFESLEDAARNRMQQIVALEALR